MIIIKEDHGQQYIYCTNINSTVRVIIEAFADRSTIEQVFHDVKEVRDAGQQQVRHLWSNIGCWHLNMWMFTLTELWAWPLTAKQLTQHDDSPRDTTTRRPSHADKRNALPDQQPRAVRAEQAADVRAVSRRRLLSHDGARWNFSARSQGHTPPLPRLTISPRARHSRWRWHSRPARPPPAATARAPRSRWQARDSAAARR